MQTGCDANGNVAAILLPHGNGVADACHARYTYNNANQVTGMAWGKSGSQRWAAWATATTRWASWSPKLAPMHLGAFRQLAVETLYDDNNRQTKANNVALSYDDNGNLLNDGSRSYVWDDRDRLSQIQKAARRLRASAMTHWDGARLKLRVEQPRTICTME